MISRLLGAVFAPKYPKGYTGRHRIGITSARDAVVAPATTVSVSHEAAA